MIRALRNWITINKLGDKRGAALLTVLVFFFTLLVGIISVIMLTGQNSRMARSTSKLTSSFFVAEAGLREVHDVVNKSLRDGSDLLCEDAVFQLVAKELSEFVEGQPGYRLLDDGFGLAIDYGDVMGEHASSEVLLQHNGNHRYSFVSTGD